MRVRTGRDEVQNPEIYLNMELLRLVKGARDEDGALYLLDI